ncbi:MAG: hypothetical protein CMI53_05645 [Parcubacteria group bacterium]|mgnify:CR=1 FL=1|jgi:hypothetical protein|nr:hypothetical protein [Parcubacteria group bacterium]|tara:strand:- start:7442 stop:7756 length:315 start_codon:yes stop_codon:yes gene_type:complete
MKLSALQKYILKQSIQSKDKIVSKSILEKFYIGKKKKPSPKDVITIITKSVDRLIKKELVIGYGWKTPHKWYINKVRLTPKGNKVAKSLLGIQQKLPLKSKKSK